MTFNIMSFNIMTFNITTLSITAFSIMDLIVTLSIKDTEDNDTRHKHKGLLY
jgi:hypothetical protein